MDVRPPQKLREPRNLFLDGALADLNVEKEKRVPRCRPSGHLLDQRVGHAQTVFTVTSRISLRDHDNQMKCGLHRMCWIGAVPRGDFTIEPLQHLIWRKLAEDSHSLRKWIAVVGDDALRGEDGTR